MKQLGRACVLLVVSVILWSGSVRAADTWTYGSSGTVEAFSTSGAGTVRDALSLIDRTHAFLVALLPDLPVESRLRTRLVVFSTDQQFAPYRGDASARVATMTAVGQQYLLVNRLDEGSTKALMQEYVRLLRRPGSYPAWLDVGLREMLSSLQMTKGKLTMADMPADTLAPIRAPGATMLDLNRLFAVTTDSPEYASAGSRGIFRAQSTLLTHMLVVDDRYRFNGSKFLRLVLDGMSTPQAINVAYGKGLDVVAKDLTAYASRTKYQNLDDPNPDLAKPPQTRALSAFEGDLLAATLLAGTRNGAADARLALDTLEQKNPSQLAVIEARALLEMQHGTPAAALSYFDRAVTLGTRNVGLLRAYVAADSANAETILAKAVELVPEDVDLRVDYAKLLVGQKKGRAAVVALVRVSPTTERAFEYYEQLAMAYLQMEKPEDAKETAEKLSTMAKPGPQTEAVATLMTSIANFGKTPVDAVSFSDDLPVENKPSPPVEPVARAEVVALTGAAVAQSNSARDGIILADTVSVTGRIRNIICARGGADLTLEVLAGGKTLRLFVDDKLKILVYGKTKDTVNLTCGSQNVPIKIAYKPGVDKARDTIGYVRVLDYRP